MKPNILLATLALCFTAQSGTTQAYTPAALKGDLALAIATGHKSYSNAITVSQILSAGLAPRKKVRLSMKPSDMVKLRRQLVSIPNRKIKMKRGRGSAIRPGDLAELAKPTVGPAPTVDLVKVSQKFQAICARLVCQMTPQTPQAEQLRLALGSFLKAKANRQNRWYLTSLVEVICAVKGLEKYPSVQLLNKLTPPMHKESRAAMRKINWGFAQIMAKSKAARKGLQKYARTLHKRPPLKAKQLKKIKSRRRPGKSQMVPPKRARGLLGNILNDIADNLQEDFDQGCEYGETAAQVIGLASGAHGVYNGIATNPTVHGAVQAVTGFATDTFNPMDPSGAIGHYAGGVVGMVGGALGTAAGWICGTIESQLANRRTSTAKRSKGKQAELPINLF